MSMQEITGRLDAVADAVQSQRPHLALTLDRISDRLENTVKLAEDLAYNKAYGQLVGTIRANLEEGRIAMIKTRIENLQKDLPQEFSDRCKPILLIIKNLEESFDNALKKAEAYLRGAGIHAA